MAGSLSNRLSNGISHSQPTPANCSRTSAELPFSALARQTDLQRQQLLRNWSSSVSGHGELPILLRIVDGDPTVKWRSDNIFLPTRFCTNRRRPDRYTRPTTVCCIFPLPELTSLSINTSIDPSPRTSQLVLPYPKPPFQSSTVFRNKASKATHRSARLESTWHTPRQIFGTIPQRKHLQRKHLLDRHNSGMGIRPFRPSHALI